MKEASGFYPGGVHDKEDGLLTASMIGKEYLRIIHILCRILTRKKRSIEVDQSVARTNGAEESSYQV